MDLQKYYNDERQKILNLIKPLKIGMVIRNKYHLVDLMVSLSEKHTLTFEIADGSRLKLLIDRQDTNYNIKYGGHTDYYSFYLDNNFISRKKTPDYKELLSIIKILLNKNEKRVAKIDFEKKESFNTLVLMGNDPRNIGYEFVKSSESLIESIYNYKYQEEKIKYVFDLKEIEKGLEGSLFENIKVKSSLVIFSSEVEFYELYFFQFFNYFFPKKSVELLFLSSSPMFKYLEKVDQTKIIFKLKNKYKYDYIFSVGSSVLFDDLLRDRKMKSKFVLFNVGVSEGVLEKKNKSKTHELFKRNKRKGILDVYDFNAKWPALSSGYKKYYGASLIKINQTYPLLPLTNLIRFNRNEFLFDLVFLGESIFNIKMNKYLAGKKSLILSGSFYRKINSYKKELIRLSENKKMVVLPNITHDLFEKIILLSKVIILPEVFPSKTGNTCIALGKCLVVNSSLPAEKFNFNKNIALIEKDGASLIEKYLKNNRLNLKMSEKNIDFAVKYFDLTTFFRQIINNYFRQ